MRTMSNGLDGGWIYVMMTSSNYSRFKLGRTKKNPLGRQKTLRTADPGEDLQAAYFIPALHGKLSRIEVSVHRQFEGRIAFHDESLSEWFPGSAQWACEWLENLFEDWTGQPVAGIDLLGQGRICRAYEADLLSLYGPVTPLGPDGIPW